VHKRAVSLKFSHSERRYDKNSVSKACPRIEIRKNNITYTTKIGNKKALFENHHSYAGSGNKRRKSKRLLQFNLLKKNSKLFCTQGREDEELT